MVCRFRTSNRAKGIIENIINLSKSRNRIKKQRKGAMNQQIPNTKEENINNFKYISNYNKCK